MRSVFAHVLRRAFARSAENFQPGRRAFLRKSALAGATLMLPLQGCFDHKKSVAIIGAGIAGLTTAYELKKITSHLSFTKRKDALVEGY